MPPLALVLLLMNATPAPKAAVLETSFAVTPSVAEPGTPPRLRVTIRNQAKQPIDFVRFETDACFAHFYLGLELTLPDGTQAPLAMCPIKAWPGTKATLAANAREVRTLDLAKVFEGVNWGAGEYRLQLAWRPTALDEVSNGAWAWRSSNAVTQVERFTLRRALGHGRVARGKTLTFPDGSRFTFTSHSHKSVERDQSSPLIIYGAWAAAGQKEPTPFQVSVFPEESGAFTVGEGVSLVLGQYEYDGFMDLTLFGRSSP